MGRELIFDRFSQQALHTLHRYRAVMFSPTMLVSLVVSCDFFILISYTFNMSILWTTDRLSLKYRNGY